MEETKKNRVGRPSNDNEKAAIIECVNNGLGYLRSIPSLIEAGYVDESGNCTISERRFSYVRKMCAETRTLSIKLPADTFHWADEHQDEILAYINARMAQDK